MHESLEQLFKLAESDSDRADAMSEAAFLSIKCAGGRMDTETSVKDLDAAIDYCKRAVKLERSVRLSRASELWANYGVALFKRMSIDNRISQDKNWLKAFNDAFDRAELLDPETQAAIHKDRSGFAKKLKTSSNSAAIQWQ